MNPNLPLIQPMTQRAQYDLTISRQILFARLAGFFGFLAVVVVATGLYGTLAYRVNNRTVEIGVRIAVGAQRSQVVWLVLRDSLMLTAFGVTIGIPLALLVGRALTLNSIWSEAIRCDELCLLSIGRSAGRDCRERDSVTTGSEYRSIDCAAIRVGRLEKLTRVSHASVISVISGGQLKRRGTLTVPTPRLT